MVYQSRRLWPDDEQLRAGRYRAAGGLERGLPGAVALLVEAGPATGAGALIGSDTRIPVSHRAY